MFFIFEHGGANSQKLEARKTIRSQAMRNFRQRQREARHSSQKNGDSPPRLRHRTLYPAKRVRHLLPASSTDLTTGCRQSYIQSTTNSACSPQLIESLNHDNFEEHTLADSLSDNDRILRSDGEEVPLIYDEPAVPFDSQPECSLDVGKAELQICQASTSETTDQRLSEISCALTWRDQLRQAFIASYYSDSVLSSNLEFINTFHCLAPQSAAMDSSRDALCLIHLGIHSGDKRLLYEGRKIHCAALRFIRHEIEKPDAIASDSILGACYTVAHCEIYQVISQEGKGWQTHMNGLYYLLQQRGSRSIISPFAQAIFHNIRQIGVMDQLLRRKKTFLSSPTWLTATGEVRQPALTITNIALQISEALEDAEDVAYRRVQDTDTPGGEVESLLLRMQKLEDDLQQWLLDFHDSSGVGKPPYVQLSISQYPLFEERCGTLAGLIRLVYKFPNLLSATSHMYVWICLLAVRMALVGLAQLRTCNTSKSCSTLTDEANECATHLCRTLAFLSSQQHRSAGTLACSAPLYWAERWFNSQKDAKRTQLCRNIRHSLEEDSPIPLNLHHPVFTWWMLPKIL